MKHHLIPAATILVALSLAGCAAPVVTPTLSPTIPSTATTLPTLTPTWTPPVSPTPGPTATPFPYADLVLGVTFRPEGSPATQAGIADLSSGDSRALTGALRDAQFAGWSPDGCHVLIILHTETSFLSEIYSAGPDGSNLARLTNSEDLSWRQTWQTGPSLSPDGTTLLYTEQIRARTEVDETLVSFVQVIGAGDDEPRRLTFSGSDSGGMWSPDGEQVAFISRRDGRPEMYAINLDGTGLRRLSYLPDDRGRVDYIPTAAGWSPRGDLIALFIQEINDDLISRAQWQLTLVPVDGSWQQQSILPDGADISYGSWLAWSPDGDRLAFSVSGSGLFENPHRHGLFLLDVDSGTVELLLGDDANPFEGIAWLPGRDALLFTRLGEVHAVEIDSREVTPLGVRVARNGAMPAPGRCVP